MDGQCSDAQHHKEVRRQYLMVWKCQIEAYMLLKGCRSVLENSRPVDETMRHERDGYSTAVLLLALSDEQAELVCHLETAKEIWERLIQGHRESRKVSKITIQKEFFNTSMRPGEKVIAYTSRLQGLFGNCIEFGHIPFPKIFTQACFSASKYRTYLIPELRK